MSEENKKPEKKEVEEEIVTIHDFKSMLIGMDLVLGDNWVPDEKQWARIRKKLDALIETAERPGGVAPSFPPYVPGNNPVVNAAPVDPNASLTDAELVRSFPSVPGGVPESIPMGEAAPAGPSALTPPPAAPPLQAPPVAAPVADGSGTQVKTPDIDSSGGYKSSFV